ncbi:MAG TPA: hypothetical protein VJ086_07605 [Rubrobacteraceae bacterium]|nr:hypothetical protein [Rubrobacteraceae bacterium]
MLTQKPAHQDRPLLHAGSEFESEDFDTIGGLVFGHLGRAPELVADLVVRERGEEDTSGEQSRR